MLPEAGILWFSLFLIQSMIQRMSNVRSEHSEREGITLLDGFLVNSIFADVNVAEYAAMLDKIGIFSHHFKSSSTNS